MRVARDAPRPLLSHGDRAKRTRRIRPTGRLRGRAGTAFHGPVPSHCAQGNYRSRMSTLPCSFTSVLGRTRESRPQWVAHRGLLDLGQAQKSTSEITPMMIATKTARPLDRSTAQRCGLTVASIDLRRSPWGSPRVRRDSSPRRAGSGGLPGGHVAASRRGARRLSLFTHLSPPRAWRAACVAEPCSPGFSLHHSAKTESCIAGHPCAHRPRGPHLPAPRRGAHDALPGGARRRRDVRRRRRGRLRVGVAASRRQSRV